jgi:hypothetical protein
METVLMFFAEIQIQCLYTISRVKEKRALKLNLLLTICGFLRLPFVSAKSIVKLALCCIKKGIQVTITHSHQTNTEKQRARMWPGWEKVQVEIIILNQMQSRNKQPLFLNYFSLYAKLPVVTLLCRKRDDTALHSGCYALMRHG